MRGEIFSFFPLREFLNIAMRPILVPVDELWITHAWRGRKHAINYFELFSFQIRLIFPFVLNSPFSPASVKQEAVANFFRIRLFCVCLLALWVLGLVWNGHLWLLRMCFLGLWGLGVVFVEKGLQVWLKWWCFMDFLNCFVMGQIVLSRMDCFDLLNTYYQT